MITIVFGIDELQTHLRGSLVSQPHPRDVFNMNDISVSSDIKGTLIYMRNTHAPNLAQLSKVGPIICLALWWIT